MLPNDMPAYTLNLDGHLMDLSTPRIMAIINATPDSFYTSCTTVEAAVDTAQRAVAEGADIIDLGGCSTRPGAVPVSAAEETDRLSRAADAIRNVLPDVPLSIDTYRADVARHMVKHYGACIINDISGGQLDDRMFDTVADTGVAYVLTHMRGTPKTMNSLTDYDDLMADVIDFMQQRIFVLKQRGVKDIIIDPGFGFAKTLEQNYTLLAHLDYLHVLDMPILAGLSHKSMLYRPLNIRADDAEPATTAANTLALAKGASLLRVHNVAAARQAIGIACLTRRADTNTGNASYTTPPTDA